MARQVAVKQISGLAEALGARVPTSRTVTGTGGLVGGGDLTANRTISLASNLLALHGLTGAGLSARTGVDSWALRSLAPSWGISIANPDGASGNPTIATVHPVSAKSADYTAVLGDGGKLITFNALATLTLPTAASAGNGWYVMVSNVGGSTVTIDGASTETIEGALTLTLAPGTSTIVICDGSIWRKVSGSLNVTSDGIVVRTSAGVFASRSIAVVSTARLTVTLADGVSGNPTLDLATVGTPGTYRSVSVDAYGRVTAGTNPTTLSGYGISDAQPLDATLTAMAGVTTAADRIIYFSGVDTAAATPLTGFARGLLDDATASEARTTLGAAATSHTHAWSDITSGKPTTLSGYGISDAQPLDASLTALAGATNGANTLLYFTATDTVSSTSITAFGRSLLDDADASAARTTLGAAAASHTHAWSDITSGKPTTLSGYGITDAQPLNAALTAISSAVSSANSFLYYTGVVVEATAITAYGRSLVAAADAAATRTLLGVDATGHAHAWSDITSGKPTTLSGYGITDAQGLDATLTAMAGVTTAADRILYFTGADAAAAATLTSFGRSLIDDADAAAARTTLGAAATSHTHAWSDINSGKPTTLSGYGITDALANNATQTLTGSLTITGGLTVQGTVTTTNQETIVVTSNKLVLNDGETGAGVAAGWSGIEIERGTLDNFFFRFDETTDRFVIGTAASLQMVATREDSPISGGIAVWDAGNNRFGTVAASTYQASDATLTAMAGVTTAADRVLYFTGVDTAAAATLTAYGRSLIDDADATAARTTLGLVIGTNVQAYNAGLASVAGLTGAGVVTATGTSTFAMRALGAASGTDILTRADGDGRYPQLSTNNTFAGLVTITNANDALLTLNVTAVDWAYIRTTVNGVARWHVGMNNTAESGSNVGSDFFINRRDDAGASIATALTIRRSDGRATFESVYVGANAVWHAGNLTPSNYQPLDATLTAMAGVTTAADRILYFTGADAAAATPITSFGRTLLDDADAAAARTTLGAAATSHTHAWSDIASGKPTTLSGYGITDAQGLDSTLTAIAGAATDVNTYIYFTATDTAAVGTITSFGRTLVGLADAAAARTTLGVAAASHAHAWADITSGKPTTLSGYGITDAQALDATLTTMAGVSVLADTFIYFTGVDVAAVGAITSFGRSLLDDIDATAARTTLGAAAASHTHAWSAIISGTPTTLSGYGITDALSNSTTSTQDGYFQGVRLRDSDGSHYLRLVTTSNLTAARTLTFLTGDSDRTVTVAGTASITGTNTGDQTITLTGEVTGAGTGSFAATIAPYVVSRIKQVPYTPGGGTRNQDFVHGLSEWFAPATSSARIVTRTRAQVATDGGAANAPSSQVARFAPDTTNITVLYGSSLDPATALGSGDGAIACEGETWIVKAWFTRTSNLVALAYLDLIALNASGSTSTVASAAITSSNAAWTETVVNGLMPSGTVRVFASVRLATNATVTGYLFATQIRLFPSASDRLVGSSGGSGVDADSLQGFSPSTSATINTVAIRDGSGGLTVATLSATAITVSGSAAQRDTDTVFWSSDSNQFFKNTALGMRTSLGLASGGSGDIWGKRAATETISGAWSFSETIAVTRATGDSIFLNGTTSNWIKWNVNGTAAPAFTTRSVGTKLLLRDALSGSAVDFAIGLASNTLWSSIPNSSSQFQWFAGQTAIASLTGSGDLTINGSFYATTKSFQIAHPTRPGFLLRHGSLEGPEFGVYSRGTARVNVLDVIAGMVMVLLPDYWIDLVAHDSVTVNLTVGHKNARAWIHSIGLDHVMVGVEWNGGEIRSFDLHWMAIGERKDTARLVVEVPAQPHG